MSGLSAFYPMLLVGLFLGPTAGMADEPSGADEPPGADEMTVTVFKSPYCGCCQGYVAYLKQHGYQVDVENLTDLAPVKAKYGVASELQSCHTGIFGDYVVEGHVPLKYVKRLLEQKPDIRGISLPGMPNGVPGMPGEAPAQLSVYTIADNPVLFAAD